MGFIDSYAFCNIANTYVDVIMAIYYAGNWIVWLWGIILHLFSTLIFVQTTINTLVFWSYIRVTRLMSLMSPFPFSSSLQYIVILLLFKYCPISIVCMFASKVDPKKIDLIFDNQKNYGSYDLFRTKSGSYRSNNALCVYHFHSCLFSNFLRLKYYQF